ncbi:MAG: pilus assembly protein [Abditibacteriales bacterium]|nr:pilus assembly protein [Abditibacteriales bacterium]MDW8365134.1 TadE/TadG family type IV pilus assembly protein [Abditibacteriales bacterium]
MGHRSPCRKLRGQSALEFALILPVILLLVLGIVAFGVMFSHKLTMDNAARDACRVGATGATDQTIANTVRDRMKLLNNTAGPMTVASSSSTAVTYRNASGHLNVIISPKQGTAQRAVGNSLTVTVRYSDYIPVPIVGVFTNPRRMLSQCTMRIESVP